MTSPMARVPSGVRPPLVSAVRAPPASAARPPARSPPPRSTSSSEWRSSMRGAQDRAERVGDALAGDVGRRAVDGLVQAAACPSPSEALGSMPSEPVSTAASSVRMSPNMFSVTITSKLPGCGDQPHGAGVDQLVLERDVAELAPSSVATWRHRRDDSSTLALSTEVTPSCGAAPRAGRRADDAADLVVGVHAACRRRAHGRRRLARGTCGCAEVQAAGQLAHDQHVDAREALGLERRGVDQLGVGLDRAQVGVQAERLAASPAGPARAAPWRAGSSHFGPPTAPSSTASAARQAAERSRRAAARRSRRWRCRRSGARRTRSRGRTGPRRLEHARAPRRPPRGRCRHRASNDDLGFHRERSLP